MAETYEQQMKDSNMIFTAISTGDFDNYVQAQQAVVMFYVPDMSVSRSGISHAMKRLERFYAERNKTKAEVFDSPLIRKQAD